LGRALVAGSHDKTPDNTVFAEKPKKGAPTVGPAVAKMVCVNGLGGGLFLGRLSETFFGDVENPRGLIV